MPGEFAQQRKTMAHEIGVVLDDVLEKYKVARSEQEGLKAGVILYRRKITDFMKVQIDQDIEDGKLDLEQGDLVRRYLLRVVNTSDVLVSMADLEVCRAQGRAQAMEVAVRLTKKACDAEDTSPAPPLSEAEQEQRHPGVSLKQQRLLEEKAVPTPDEEKVTPEPETKPASKSSSKKSGLQKKATRGKARRTDGTNPR